MAPTKAKATYAATTLSLLAIGDAPLIHVCPPRTREASKGFRDEKVSAAVPPAFPHRTRAREAWLKIHEINMLKSL
jgi:hypothetical protein